MPVNVECTSCGLVLLGFESGDPRPVGKDECPRCQTVEFVLAD
ncbi:hypothetical protein ACFOZ7_16945 [Natribaculum luteum]|uniref:Small CPxCG-related zinc finger protein n=1 Tax=Natribaculum luteum TaxID=1586232 RepID=A0ABD5P397_9EURY|nr:hypothetical protein [Natribaculum luteum]